MTMGNDVYHSYNFMLFLIFFFNLKPKHIKLAVQVIEFFLFYDRWTKIEINFFYIRILQSYHPHQVHLKAL